MRLYSYLVLNENQSDSYKKIFSELLKKFKVSKIEDLSIEYRDQFFKELIKRTGEEK